MRAGAVIDTAVQYARIVSRLVRGNLGFFFKNQNAILGMRLMPAIRSRQPNNAAAYNRQIPFNHRFCCPRLERFLYWWGRLGATLGMGHPIGASVNIGNRSGGLGMHGASRWNSGGVRLRPKRPSRTPRLEFSRTSLHRSAVHRSAVFGLLYFLGILAWPSVSVGAVPQQAPASPEIKTTSEGEAANGSTSTAAEAFSLGNDPPPESGLLPEDDYELMRLFVDTLDEVERNYVRPIERRELMEAAIEGVLSKLDDYSDYIAPEHLDAFRRELDSQFGGIGIHVDQNQDGELRIITPLARSPGLRAGLRADDVILAIDGRQTAGWTVEQAVQRMKGPVGSSVSLKVRHRDATVETLQMDREMIAVETVFSYQRTEEGGWDSWIDAERGVAYFWVRSFGARTTGDLKALLTALPPARLRGLILDLRSNPGGLLTSAIEMCDLFLERGTIVSTQGRNVKTRTWSASGKVAYTGFPMVVLVDQQSASASEIVAACLQDHSRAIVIGERSWGKGSVQRVVELEQGKSALKLTTSSYVRPNGGNIHRFPDAAEEDEWGVRPNPGFEVALNFEERQRLIRRQRQSLYPRPRVDGATFFLDAQLQKALAYLQGQR